MGKKVRLCDLTRLRKSVNRKIKNIFCCLIVGMIQVAHADIAVIVNSANSGTSLRLSDVQSIFLGLQTRLPNGSAVIPVDQGQNQAIRQQFYQLVAGKNSVEMKTYWSRSNFTGRGTPPAVVAGGSAVLSHVASDKNAIGYVDSSLVKPGDGVSTALLIPTH